jgi:hypothetical protein
MLAPALQCREVHDAIGFDPGNVSPLTFKPAMYLRHERLG